MDILVINLISPKSEAFSYFCNNLQLIKQKKGNFCKIFFNNYLNIFHIFQIDTGGPGVNPAKYGVDQFKARVEVRIECNNLLNKDVMSKSDPCAAFYMMKGGRWEEVIYFTF